MKTQFTWIIMLICISTFAQNKGTNDTNKGTPFTFNGVNISTNLYVNDYGKVVNSYQSDCGHWVEDSLIYSEWKTIKLILQYNGKNEWVYDEIRSVVSNTSLAVYCPCGCGHDSFLYQDRVCKNTGVVQRCDIIQTYKYIPQPKNNFQKTLDSLSKKQ